MTTSPVRDEQGEQDPEAAEQANPARESAQATV